jgi:hypothetical protein
MKDRNDRATPRPNSRDRADSRAGDEGLEENMQGSSQRSRAGNVRVDDVRDPNSIDRLRNNESASSFEGQGGQKGGSRGSEQGAGYTEDRSEPSREDDSRSGSQGRQGKTGSRQGRQPGKTERASEQSEKSSRDDVDRTLM